MPNAIPICSWEDDGKGGARVYGADGELVAELYPEPGTINHGQTITLTGFEMIQEVE